MENGFSGFDQGSTVANWNYLPVRWKILRGRQQEERLDSLHGVQLWPEEVGQE
jgi:hypothetical protein